MPPASLIRLTSSPAEGLPVVPLVTVPFCFFFFNDPATSEISTFPLHDALPIWSYPSPVDLAFIARRLDAYERLIRLDKPIGTLLLLWPTLWALWLAAEGRPSAAIVLIFVLGDRKSTRLNSSHSQISYAVFCLQQ